MEITVSQVEHLVKLSCTYQGSTVEHTVKAVVYEHGQEDSLRCVLKATLNKSMLHRLGHVATEQEHRHIREQVQAIVHDTDVLSLVVQA